MSCAATLVTGADAGAREEAIAAALAPGLPTAILLEGVPDGSDRFSRFLDDPAWQLQALVRIAPGCLCCAGNLTMRVHLNRLLRGKPARLFIGVSAGTHLDTLTGFLSAAPYDALLALTPPLLAGMPSPANILPGEGMPRA